MENNDDTRVFKIEYPVQTTITYSIKTNKTDKQVMEDIANVDGDILMLAGENYQIGEQDCNPENASHDDRNSTYLYDEGFGLLYEYDPNTGRGTQHT